MALAADTATLDFHISPLLRTGGLSAQIRQSLNDLIRDTHGETIVKLRAFLSGAGKARRVDAEVSQIFTEKKRPLPVLSIIQVGGLGDERATVVIEAVVETRRTLNPNGLAFLAGQTGPSFTQAFQRLQASVQAASVSPEHVLKCTCFTAEPDYAAVEPLSKPHFPGRSSISGRRYCANCGLATTSLPRRNHHDYYSRRLDSDEQRYTVLSRRPGKFLHTAAKAILASAAVSFQWRFLHACHNKSSLVL